MKSGEKLSLEQIKMFLSASEEFRFEASNREEPAPAVRSAGGNHRCQGKAAEDLPPVCNTVGDLGAIAGGGAVSEGRPNAGRVRGAGKRDERHGSGPADETRQTYPVCGNTAKEDGMSSGRRTAMERSEGAIPVAPWHGNSPADRTRQQDPVACHTVKTDGMNSGAPGGRRRL